MPDVDSKRWPGDLTDRASSSAGVVGIRQGGPCGTGTSGWGL